MRASIQRSRFAVLAAAVVSLIGTLVLAASVAATAPVKEPFEDSWTTHVAAGELCDFNYHEDVTVTGWNQEFFDQAGNFLRLTTHLTLAVAHVNSDTGYTLTEIVHQTQTFVEATETVKVVGTNWMLRDPTGKLLVAHAGQLIFDFSIGEVVKLTPNFDEDFGDLLCPALGGNRV